MKLHGTDWPVMTVIAGAGCVAIYAGAGARPAVRGTGAAERHGAAVECHGDHGEGFAGAL